ncbi:MAG: CRTAC1 family protein [Acidobacteriota bacterium]
MRRGWFPPAAVMLAVAVGGCQPAPVETSEVERTDVESSASTSVDRSLSAAADPVTGGPFVDRSAEAGLDFVHWNGMSGEYYYSEMMGAGGALFDVDGDGDLDLFLVQGAWLGDGPIEGATFPQPAHGLGDRLYRNDSNADDVRFTDVTESALAGIEPGYGMGVAVADFDADGRPDLFLTRADRNRHLRNVDGVRFEDVSDAVTGSTRWGVPAVPFDADGDGDVDLFVGHYVDYTTAVDKRCPDELGQPNYCGPLAYPGVRDGLLLNRGDGTFEEVSGRAGFDAAYSAALGAVAFDADGDGRLDIYVANDGTPNQLWRNLGPGPGGVPRFEDRAVAAGAAVNGLGRPEASMGVAVADADGDGVEDLFLTHLARETHTLYVADGAGGFVDRTAASGLGAPSFDRTGFGCGFADFDHDGHLDLLTVAGAVKVIKARRLDGDPYPLDQPDQLFRGLDGGRFEVWDAGEVIDREAVSRGVVLGDVDGDGDVDAVVTENAGPARLLINTVGQDRPWIGLRLLDERGVDVPAALATVTLADGRQVVRRVGMNASYASSGEPRLHIGLADGDTASGVVVTWPGGARERFPAPASGQNVSLARGAGELIP